MPKEKQPPKISLLHRIPYLDIVLSIRSTAIMLKSGLALEDALQVLADQSHDPKLRQVYLEIVKDITSGETLTSAMSRHKDVFPGIILSVVEVGEQGGTLEGNLSFLAEFLRKDYEFKKKIRGALIYPLIVLGLTALEALGVIFFILPKLESLFFAFENIPAYTMSIMNGAKFLRENAYAVAGGSVLALALLYLFSKTTPGRTLKDWLAIHFPIIKKLAISNILASFARTLSVLLESGVPLARALEIASTTTGNSLYAAKIKQVYETVSNGESVATALSQHHEYFPVTFSKMIEVGEKTGTMEENFKYLHDFYQEDVENMSNNLTTLIEPLLLIGIGVMIGFLAIAIIGPIYQLTSSING